MCIKLQKKMFIKLQKKMFIKLQIISKIVISIFGT